MVWYLAPCGNLIRETHSTPTAPTIVDSQHSNADTGIYQNSICVCVEKNFQITGKLGTQTTKTISCQFTGTGQGNGQSTGTRTEVQEGELQSRCLHWHRTGRRWIWGSKVEQGCHITKEKCFKSRGQDICRESVRGVTVRFDFMSSLERDWVVGNFDSSSRCTYRVSCDDDSKPYWDFMSI